MNAAQRATRILLKSSKTKVIFLAQNLCNLGFVLNKLMQLERVTDWGLGGGAPNHWAMFVILQHKSSDFNGILIIFSTF